jgi:hypothetical protein
MYMLKLACICGAISGRALNLDVDIPVVVLRNHQSLLAFGTTFKCLVFKSNVH